MALPPQVFAVKFRAHSILKAAGYISAAAITRWAGKTQIILKKAAALENNGHCFARFEATDVFSRFWHHILS